MVVQWGSKGGGYVLGSQGALKWNILKVEILIGCWMMVVEFIHRF